MHHIQHRRALELGSITLMAGFFAATVAAEKTTLSIDWWVVLGGIELIVLFAAMRARMTQHKIEAHTIYLKDLEKLLNSESVVGPQHFLEDTKSGQMAQNEPRTNIWLFAFLLVVPVVLVYLQT